MSGFCLVEQNEDQAFSVCNFGDALLPPGEKLLVRQGREEFRDGSVVSDARGVDGSEIGNQVAVLTWREESHCS